MGFDEGIVNKLFRLDGKVALITGAAGGIGQALCLGLAGAGAKVALADIRQQAVEMAAEKMQRQNSIAAAFSVDLASHESVKRLVQEVIAHFGRIDILVNCAGINRREPILDVTETTFEQIVAVNLRGVYQLSQAVAPHMIRQGGGKIINIGSLTRDMGLAGVSVYGATKAGVSALTLSMAVEWAKYNIQANCIEPGFMKTELTAALWSDPEKEPWMRGRVAMERPGEPEELIGALLLFAGNASSYVTGQTWCIDGGVTAGGKHW